MSKKFIILLSFIFTFIFTNNSYAEDYLDTRWAKTGCKPLNERTKNALIPTDLEREFAELGIKNLQFLYFSSPKLKDYKYYGTGTSRKNNGKITRIYKIELGLADDDPAVPIEKKPYFNYSRSAGSEKGACSGKIYKGTVFTVYLLKDKKDKKPYKWLEFQSTGKGSN